MACNVDCDLTPSNVSGSCSTGDVEIPKLPDDLIEDIQVPEIGTVTTETIDGIGVFDIYMRAGMNQLDTQWKEGRIKGKEYAEAYIQTVQIMMTEANKFVLGEVAANVAIMQAQIAAAMYPMQHLTAAYEAAFKMAQAKKTEEEINLLCQQIAELKENGGVERLLKEKQAQTQVKQAELYTRQIKGFNDKASTDANKIIMDAWAVSAVEEPDATVYSTGFEKGGVAPDNLTTLSNLA